MPDALSRIAIPSSTVDVDSPSLPGVLSSLTLEPTWLAKVHLGQNSDPSLVPLLERAATSDAEFVFRTVHGLSLLYRSPKPGIY